MQIFCSNRYRRERPKVDARIFDSALGHTRHSDAVEFRGLNSVVALRSILNFFACGQVSSPRIYRLRYKLKNFYLNRASNLSISLKRHSFSSISIPSGRHTKFVADSFGTHSKFVLTSQQLVGQTTVVCDEFSNSASKSEPLSFLSQPFVNHCHF